MATFPTNKAHVSYSEVKAWAECPFRHNLMYVQGINTYVDNPYADFGTVVHDQIEQRLNGKEFSIDLVNEKLTKIWAEKKYDSPEYIKQITEERAVNGWKYNHESLDDMKQSAANVINSFDSFMDETFPGWEPISAEHQLYENIDNDMKFKGFIDCIIARPKKPGSDKVEYWVIDWKTTGKNGWFYKKKKEFLSLAQVALYKHYWANKFNVPLKDIKVGYVFLKRGAKPDNCIELFSFSAGPTFIDKANNLVSRMIKNVRKGVKLKNYNNCKFCPYKNTEHCSGKGW